MRESLEKSDRLLLINAMGGVGKTSLANALFNRYKDSYKHLIWLDAKIGVKEAFINSTALIDNLGISEEIAKLNDGKQSGINRCFDLLVNRLRTLEKYGLLVIDDADEKMEVLAPVLSLTNNWKVLVTSRDLLEGFEIYRLGFLSLRSTVNLFFYYAKIDRTNVTVPIVEKIVSAVWCHTLTVELLAKTIRENDGFTIQHLLEALTTGGIKAVPDYEIKTNYAQEKSGRETVRTTTNACLKIAFDINGFSKEPLLESILINFSVLPPIPISYLSIEKIFEISAGDSVIFNNALKKLVDTSWLVKSDKGYHMHPVIQEVTREYSNVTPEKTAKLIEALTDISKSFDAMPSAVLFLFSSYIKTVIDTFEKTENSAVANLAYNYAVLLRNIGRPKEALAYHDIAKRYREKKEPGSASLAEVLCGIAAVKINQNELKEALDLQTEALRLQQLNLAPDDFNIAISHHNLGVIYKKMSDIDSKYQETALTHLQTAVDILSPDQDHLEELATSLILKGQLEKRQHKYEDARNSFGDSLKIRSKIFGNEHHKTMKIQEDLAMIYKLEENWDEGYRLMHAAMLVLTEYYEPTSHSLGASHHNYAYFLFKKGLIEEAILEQNKAVNIFKLHFDKGNTQLVKAEEQLKYFLGNS
ncbi:tetratricopeptide repeat protein [Ferruginibacter sp.]